MTDQTSHDDHEGHEGQHDHTFSLMLWQHGGVGMLELHRWDSPCDPEVGSPEALIAALRHTADLIEEGLKAHLAERN